MDETEVSPWFKMFVNFAFVLFSTDVTEARLAEERKIIVLVSIRFGYWWGYGLYVVWSTPFEGEQNCWSGSTFRCFCQIFRQILADSQQYLCGLAPYVTTFLYLYLYLRNKSKQIHSVFWLPRAISGHTCCPPESLPESNSHQSSPEHLLPWFPPKYQKNTSKIPSTQR